MKQEIIVLYCSYSTYSGSIIFPKFSSQTVNLIRI